MSRKTDEIQNLIAVYRPLPVIKKLPILIECLTSYDDYLLVGTKDGNVLSYKCILKNHSDSKFDIQIIATNKTFSKKSITQMVAVPEFKILVSLSDGIVSVHKLDPYTCDLISTVGNVRGAFSFNLDLQRKRTLTGGTQATLRMAIAAKRRIYLYDWKGKEFVPSKSSEYFEIPETPRRIVWCDEAICVGFKNEYSLLTVLKGESKALFPSGNKQTEPLIVRLKDERLGLGIDEKMYVLDSAGNPILTYAIHWSQIPTTVINDHPYLVSFMPDKSLIEVRSAEPHRLIQQLEVGTNLSSSRMTILNQCANRRGIIYVASTTDVFCLVTVPIKEQIELLMKESQYEIALELTKYDPKKLDGDEESDRGGGGGGDLEPGGKSMKKMVHDIENMQAFHLFCREERFKESLDLFFKLETNPSLVIGLFHGLLPGSTRNKIEYPYPPPLLEGTQLESALHVLNDYLVCWRTKLVASNKKSGATPTQSSHSNLNSSISSTTSSSTVFNPSRSNQELREIVDTTLLKSYLLTHDALIASLLRLPDNQCLVDETERALIGRQKYNELIIFYQCKGLHRKALDLLQSFSKKVSSPLFGHERTVRYLQDLTVDDLELIFEYATWVMKEHRDDGLRIFTEDLPEAEQLPRELVLNYLEQVSDSDAVILYLEHIINHWGERRSLFHNTLVNKYREKAAMLLAEYRLTLDCLPESDALNRSPAPAGMEPGELGYVRRKLLAFLETSDHYSSETLASFLLKDQLFEEWAAVMGKMNKHDRALSVYVHHLGDLKKAETYCDRMYDRDPVGNRDVFLVLLKIYLSESHELNPFAQESNSEVIPRNASSSLLGTPEDRLREAFKLLVGHATKIDGKEVMRLIPTSVSVQAVHKYLTAAYSDLVYRQHSGSIFRNVLLSQNLLAQEERISLEKWQKVVVTDEHTCAMCKKRLGQCDFIRYPDIGLVHYKCRSRVEKS